MAIEDMKARLKQLKQKQAEGQRKPKAEELEDESDDLAGLEDEDDQEEVDEELEDEDQELLDETDEVIEGARKVLKTPLRPKVTQSQVKAHQAVDDFKQMDKANAQDLPALTAEQEKLVKSEIESLHNTAVYRFRLIGVLTLINDNLTKLNQFLRS